MPHGTILVAPFSHQLETCGESKVRALPASSSSALKRHSCSQQMTTPQVGTLKAVLENYTCLLYTSDAADDRYVV